MKSMIDVRRLLKQFGIFIYIGNRIADLQLMEEEIRELYSMQLIDVQQFQQAILIIRKEMENEKLRIKEK